MARESKRKRDERRFGQAERLADLVGCIPWKVDPRIDLDMPKLFSGHVEEAVAVDVHNVANYIRDRNDKAWSWTELPSCRMPFPKLFLEFRTSAPLNGVFPSVGTLLVEGDTRYAIAKAEAIARTPGIDASVASRMESHASLFREQGGSLISYNMVATANKRLSRPEPVCIMHLCRGELFLRHDGTPLESPLGQVDKILAPTLVDRRRFARVSWAAVFPALLAVAFMNCKNVALQPHEPDAALNRERKRAGLKPFVRFHTIDIEPMKKVLRTEGDIESNGLKKAMHICRGHFVTYTEERPMFGQAGRVGTFWKDAHVRGSQDHGIVVSDYRVHPPAPPKG